MTSTDPAPDNRDGTVCGDLIEGERRFVEVINRCSSLS